MQTADDLIGQRKKRLEALNKLRQHGINPFPSQARKDFPNNFVKQKYTEFEGKEITLAGRLLAKREHGKLIFADLHDQSDKIQLAIRQDILIGDLQNAFLNWDHIKLIDIGDFLQVTGKLGKTKQGEITLFVSRVKLLAKSLRPLPNTLEDKEQRFRRRYLDFALHPKRRLLFERKAKFWQISREFLKKNGFIEVETPILETVTGGADAKPFITHHNALDQDFYLRISSELYQKRLIGGGFEKIFVLGPNFRNEGIDDEHLQEYYQLEWYWAYADYRKNMKLVRDLFLTLAKEIYQKTKFTTRGYSFDLAKEWPEIDYIKTVNDIYKIDIFQTPTSALQKILEKQNIVLQGAVNRQRIIDNLWKNIRRKISGPAFLINQPAFISPLAKSVEDRPEITERFQIIIAGSELGNGYSEINDPLEQLERFLQQQKLREAGDEEAQMLDIDFIEMLEYGMPPTSGYGHSERVFWFFEDIPAREGTLFPQVRQELDELTKKIYQDKLYIAKR